MDVRFKVTAVSFIVVMLLLSKADAGMMQGITGVYAALGGLLIFAAIALFPSLTRGDNVDRSKAGGGWSDRIEFDEPPVKEDSESSWR